MRKARRTKGEWIKLTVAAPHPGKHWAFYQVGDHVYVRFYYYASGGKTWSMGHWLSEGIDRLNAMLMMADTKEVTKHQLVCQYVRNDMLNWKETKTKDKFRKIVRTGT